MPRDTCKHGAEVLEGARYFQYPDTYGSKRKVILLLRDDVWQKWDSKSTKLYRWYVGAGDRDRECLLRAKYPEYTREEAEAILEGPIMSFLYKVQSA